MFEMSIEIYKVKIKNTELYDDVINHSLALPCLFVYCKKLNRIVQVQIINLMYEPVSFMVIRVDSQ